MTRPSWAFLPITNKQRDYLVRHGVSVEGLDRGKASVVISRIIEDSQDAWAHSFPDIDDDIEDPF